MVKDSGAFAVAMDIDAAGLPFLKNLTPPAGSKSVEDLREVKQAAGLPFIVKGIMTGTDASVDKNLHGAIDCICDLFEHLCSGRTLIQNTPAVV